MERQLHGGKHDSKESKNFENYEDCDMFFEEVKKVFFNINGWENLLEKGTEFQLTDKLGKDKVEEIRKGDLIKIKIPGPDNAIGDGYDWVIAENISIRTYKTYTKLNIKVRPCSSPNFGRKIAHFYNKEASSYFTIKKFPKVIISEVHGRNELPNLENLPIKSKIRNLLVSSGGIIGFGNIHWNIWAKNILNEEKLKNCTNSNQVFNL